MISDLQRQLDVGKVFTPTTPVDERSLFSGRSEQIQQVFSAVSQKGQHAIIYGERGVGKTSFANVVGQILATQVGTVLAPRATSDASDTYSTLWRKMFSEITMTQGKPGIGFNSTSDFLSRTVADELPETITPDIVRRVLTNLGQGRLLIAIIDEFDRLDESVTTQIADTIKMLSDHAVPATLVLVGVADSVDELIAEHASVERALMQIQMPRMSEHEIREIILRGMNHLEMTFEQKAADRVVMLAQGLPHYAHLLALHGTHQAVFQGRGEVTDEDVTKAVQKAVDNTQQSIMAGYRKATASPHSGNLYGHVLLACALAEIDELGYFLPSAVREPMSVLMGKYYDIPSFARHLYDFTDKERGPVLERTGTERKYRYRFENPLLQPYVIMRGLADKKVDLNTLQALMRKDASP